MICWALLTLWIGFFYVAVWCVLCAQNCQTLTHGVLCLLPLSSLLCCPQSSSWSRWSGMTWVGKPWRSPTLVWPESGTRPPRWVQRGPTPGWPQRSSSCPSSPRAAMCGGAAPVVHHSLRLFYTVTNGFRQAVEGDFVFVIRNQT